MDNKVLDEAVEVAAKALFEDQCPDDFWSAPMAEDERQSWRDGARKVLLAGMKVLLEPVVADWRTSAEVIRGFHRASWFDRGQAQGIERCADDLAAIYAPGLGEGDGR